MNAVEQQILEQAIERLVVNTGRQVRLIKNKPAKPDRVIDACVDIQGIEYTVEVKKWAQHINFGALVYQLEELPGRKLLVADYINQQLAQRLQEAGIEFMDAAGNAYVNQPDTYIYIRGNKAALDGTGGGTRVLAHRAQEAGTGRAFTAAGLKVVYELILNPELVEQPYRVMAAKADVALGTVGGVMEDLVARGAIVARGKSKHLARKEWLVQNWVEQYPLRLRPKHTMGGFIAEDPYWWRDFNVLKLEAEWGGETAAAILTQYLKPQKATLYVKDRQTLTRIVKLARLRKAPGHEANVEIYTRFWVHGDDGETVPPLLVYADLIATGDARNLETARVVYEQFLN